MPFWTDYIFCVIGLLIINAVFGLPMVIIASVIVIIHYIRYHTDYLRKLLRAFQVQNMVEFNVIRNKLKITVEEIDQARIRVDLQMKSLMTKEDYEQLNKEINDVSTK